MTVKVLLVCEDPTDNRRKMWAAQTVGNGPKTQVRVYWGRIDHGHTKIADDLIRHAKQIQDYDFDNDEKALAFIDKKVKEKTAKNYQMVLYDHDDTPMTLLCDRQPDERGFIEMQTWNGKK